MNTNLVDYLIIMRKIINEYESGMTSSWTIGFLHEIFHSWDIDTICTSGWSLYHAR